MGIAIFKKSEAESAANYLTLSLPPSPFDGLTAAFRRAFDGAKRTRAPSGRKRAATPVGNESVGKSVVVVMDDGLAFGAITMVLLDDGCPVVRLALPDDRAIAIEIAVTLTDGYAGADRANANANLVRERRTRKGANSRGNS